MSLEENVKKGFGIGCGLIIAWICLIGLLVLAGLIFGGH